MKVILLQDIKNLGPKGSVREVAEGYARNFLFPRKLAEFATEDGIKKTEMKRTAEKEQETARINEYRKLAGLLKGKKITISAKAEKGRLFGSILPKDIAGELKKYHLDIPEKCIIIKEAIKKIGEHEIIISLAGGIETKIILEVSEKK